MFKLYKATITVLGYNLFLENVTQFIEAGDDIYRYGIVGLEVFGLVVMILAIYYIKKTIEVFAQSGFDLIRENFTTDFYKKINETTQNF